MARGDAARSRLNTLQRALWPLLKTGVPELDGEARNKAIEKAVRLCFSRLQPTQKEALDTAEGVQEALDTLEADQPYGHPSFVSYIAVQREVAPGNPTVLAVIIRCVLPWLHIAAIQRQ